MASLMPGAESVPKTSAAPVVAAPYNEPIFSGDLCLAGRICQIMGGLDALEKRGTNLQQQYKYVMADDVFAMLQRRIAAAGIMIVPSVTSWENFAKPTSKGQSQITFAHMEFRIQSAHTGEVVIAKWIGESADSGDKDLAKAVTSGLKGFLSRLFLMGTGEADDPEFDGYGAGGAPKQAKPGKVDTTQTPAAAGVKTPPPPPAKVAAPAPVAASEPAAPGRPTQDEIRNRNLGRINAALAQLGLAGNVEGIRAELSSMLEIIRDGCPVVDGVPTMKGATVVQLANIADHLETRIAEFAKDIPF